MDNEKLISKIFSEIQKDPSNYRAYEDVFSLCRSLEGEDFRLAHDTNAELRVYISRGMQTAAFAKLFDLYKRSLLFDAPHNFDSYLLYLEINRKPEERFYQPRRRILKEVVDNLQKLVDDELDELFISMPPRVGKTTILMFFVTWLIGRNSESSNLYSAYSDTITKAFYNGVLETIQDPVTYLWKDVFPNAKVVGTNSADETLNIDRRKRYPSLTCRSLYGTSSNSNDQRAITIEVASDNKDPYAVTDKAYNALIDLVADICRRNGIKKLKWSTDKSERMNHLNGCNMTVHRDYANKSCPGKYLYDRHGDIAAKVNAKLGAAVEDDFVPTPVQSTIKAGDVVKILSGATYYSGKAIPGWVKNKKWIVREVSGDRAVIDKSEDGRNAICSPINRQYLSVVSAAPEPSETAWTPKVGDIVNFTGNTHYSSSNSNRAISCKPGKAKITQTYKGKHPYHLVRISGGGATVYGWVDAGTFTKA